MTIHITGSKRVPGCSYDQINVYPFIAYKAEVRNTYFFQIILKYIHLQNVRERLLIQYISPFHWLTQDLYEIYVLKFVSISEVHGTVIHMDTFSWLLQNYSQITAMVFGTCFVPKLAAFSLFSSCLLVIADQLNSVLRLIQPNWTCSISHLFSHTKNYCN